jgi:Heterokaryon incompatibility protein Het-C
VDSRLSRLSNAIALLALFTCFISVTAANAAEADCGPMHEEITHDALAATFNAANLNLVERACESQSKPGSEAASETRRHFGDENFAKALAYMDRQKRLILDFSASADTNAMDRARALYHLGLLLHTAQDFYSHTNYVELAAERMKENHGASIKDPYSMDLVDWTKLASNRTNALQTSHEIYKDDANASEGKIAFGSSNYFKIAKELAVKESIRQWNSVEALIKLRHAARANAILSAMKEASCPYIKDLDKFPEDEI